MRNIRAIFLLFCLLVLYLPVNAGSLRSIALDSLTNFESSFLQKTGAAEFVLIGDSTHGTEEFYRERFRLARLLIVSGQIQLILLESDWSNAAILNRFVHSESGLSVDTVLSSYSDYPDWIWKNRETRNFLLWLQQYNQQVRPGKTVSLYGLDLYNTERARENVLDFFGRYFPRMQPQVKQYDQCLAPYPDLHEYATRLKNTRMPSCETAVAVIWRIFSQCLIPCATGNRGYDQDFFEAQQQALAVVGAEAYFRLLYTQGDVASWNYRDRYMLESIENSRQFLDYPKTLIMAHSSHLGDARATAMSKDGQINLGQLLRQRYGDARVFSLGMLTYAGEVLASDGWGQTATVKRLLPADPDSYEGLFHDNGWRQFYLFMDDLSRDDWLDLNRVRLQRHVGVVYVPDDEMNAHYSAAQLPREFDAVMFQDKTSALHALP